MVWFSIPRTKKKQRLLTSTARSAIYGPVTICVGQKHVITGLDEELVGKKVGTEADVTVLPEKAFGERDSKKVQSYPKNKFKDKPVRGMRINVEEHGEGVVVDVIGSRVIVDFNAPLAWPDTHVSLQDRRDCVGPPGTVKGYYQALCRQRHGSNTR